MIALAAMKNPPATEMNPISSPPLIRDSMSDTVHLLGAL
jgi:hypothetical protein